MNTTTYFDETIVDQDSVHSLQVEFGRSSYYSGAELNGGGSGSDSIYLGVDGSSVTWTVRTQKDLSKLRFCG